PHVLRPAPRTPSSTMPAGGDPPRLPPRPPGRGRGKGRPADCRDPRARTADVGRPGPPAPPGRDPRAQRPGGHTPRRLGPRRLRRGPASAGMVVPGQRPRDRAGRIAPPVRPVLLRPAGRARARPGATPRRPDRRPLWARTPLGLVPGPGDDLPRPPPPD